MSLIRVNSATSTVVKPKFQAFLSAVATSYDPVSFQEPARDTKWREDMNLELHALEENDTWTITDLHPGRKGIGRKWIFKTGYNSNGTIKRHKARLVIQGCR